jgi:4-hydroxy-3-methylbut-2-en-1-yl diphosphate synthase IspG/GcpE
VERRLQARCDKAITVAVMGCAVNGPGEASAADIGVAGGDGEGVLFRERKNPLQGTAGENRRHFDGGNRAALTRQRRKSAAAWSVRRKLDE